MCLIGKYYLLDDIRFYFLTSNTFTFLLLDPERESFPHTREQFFLFCSESGKAFIPYLYLASVHPKRTLSISILTYINISSVLNLYYMFSIYFSCTCI